MVESAHARATQDIADRRAGIPGQVGEAMGSIAGLDAGRDDGLDRRTGQSPR